MRVVLVGFSEVIHIFGCVEILKTEVVIRRFCSSWYGVSGTWYVAGIVPGHIGNAPLPGTVRHVEATQGHKEARFFLGVVLSHMLTSRVMGPNRP